MLKFLKSLLDIKRSAPPKEVFYGKVLEVRPHKTSKRNASGYVMNCAGYIEAWGRGIQKICEACQELGTPDSEYKVLGDDITVKFFALESAKISESKNPKHQGDVLGDVLEDGILDELRRDSSLNQKELTEILGTSVPM